MNDDYIEDFEDPTSPFDEYGPEPDWVVKRIPNDEIFTKKCNCSIETLMREGCKCGALKNRKK